MDHHQQTIKEAFKHWNTTDKGLSSNEAGLRLAKYGANKLPDPNQKHPLLILANQFNSTLVYILFAAAAISFAYGHMLDVYVILTVIIVNGIFGFFQEFRAEKSIQALNGLIVPKGRVVRDHKLGYISASDLVPGDIIELEEGDRVPADCRLIWVENLQAQEAALTGEALPTDKQTDPLPSDTPLAEKSNMVWTGTSITRGKAKALVVTTGTHTTLGQIAKDLKTIEEGTDQFKKKTDQLSKQLGILAVLTTVVIFIVGYFIRQFGFETTLMFTLANLVASVPEGLPVVLTLVLAISAQRMAKKNAIVRRLSATGTLSSVDIIITDKTGTLTQNQMTARVVQLPYQPVIDIETDLENIKLQQAATIPTIKHYPLRKILDIASFCHSVRHQISSDNQVETIGDPTETAYVTLAVKAGHTPSYAQTKTKQLADLPFSQQYRWRASKVVTENKVEFFVTGAPEAILNHTGRVLLPDHQEHPLDDERRHHIADQIQDLTNQAMRVIGFAYKTTSPENKSKVLSHEELEDLVFVGLIGIIDPPRPEVADAGSGSQSWRSHDYGYRRSSNYRFGNS